MSEKITDLIFLCYAKEDVKTVSEVYRRLKEAGLNPWMDKPPAPYQRHGIPPGVDWDSEIRKRIEQAKVFLAFFSVELYLRVLPYWRDAGISVAKP